MKILLIYNHFAVSSGRYMTDAFKRLGHDVRHTGPAKGRSIWGLDVAAKYVHEPDGEDGHMVIEKYEPHENGTMATLWMPDLVIVMDSDPAILDRALPAQGARFSYLDYDVPHVVYGVDNHVRDYRRPWFDHYFLAHHGVSVMDWKRHSAAPNFIPPGIVEYDASDMTWLPCAYDPTLFTPSPIPYAERKFDVAMIGVMYPQRVALVNELRAAGLKVYAGTGLLFEEYRDAYHNARISLCVSAASDVAQRVFETAAMGCVIVTDELADAKRLNLIDGMNCYTYSSQDEAVAICKWLCGDESARPLKYDGEVEGNLRGLATTILSRTWANGETWDARAQVIINWIEKRQAGEAFYATSE